MGFATEKIILFMIDKRTTHNIASIEFYTAQETRILEKRDVATVPKGDSRREIAFVVAFKRNKRNA